MTSPLQQELDKLKEYVVRCAANNSHCHYTPPEQHKLILAVEVAVEALSKAYDLLEEMPEGNRLLAVEGRLTITLAIREITKLIVGWS